MKKSLLMSKVLSFITMLTLIFSICGLVPVTAQAATNPILSDSCGIDTVLVMDTSTSITGSGMTGQIGQMKTAFDGFVDAMLPSTPANIAVISFDDTATLRAGFSYPSDAGTLKTAINAIDGDGYTNWEDALLRAKGLFPVDGKPHMIVFTSDGDPTASSAGAVDLNQPNDHLAPAVKQADLAKAAGIRIVTLGIGSQINKANLEAISSPDATFTTSNFVTLATDLQTLASKFCGGRITATKIVDLGSSQTPTAGWVMNIAGVTKTTDSQGKTEAVSIIGKTGPFTVSEVSKPGFVPLSASCVITNNDNAPIGNNSVDGIVTNINLTDQDIVSCTFHNKEGLPPTGTLTATDCKIPTGASKCDSTLTWNTVNPINTSKVTTPTNITVEEANSNAVGKSYAVNFGSRTFYLYNNGDLLKQVTAHATCFEGGWDATTLKCSTTATICTIETDPNFNIAPCDGTCRDGKMNPPFCDDNNGNSLSGEDCTIKIGDNTCKTDLTLEVKNPVAGKATNITKAGNVEVSSGLNPATKKDILVNYPSTTFYLNHNGVTLTPNGTVIKATCIQGSEWKEGKCQSNIVGEWDTTWGECNAKSCGEKGTQIGTRVCSLEGSCPGPTSISRTCHKSGCTSDDNALHLVLKASPQNIMKGKSTTLSWTSDEGSTCVSKTTSLEINGKNTGTAVVIPKETITYKISCSKHGLNDTKEITVKVDAINVTEH